MVPLGPNVGRFTEARLHAASLTPEEISTQKQLPLISPGLLADRRKAQCWFFKDKIFYVYDSFLSSEDEIKLKIKHLYLKSKISLKKIEKEVEAFENFDKTQGVKREKIPNDVRLFVWQRDEGKCTQCNNKEKLEFDHIIPVSEGGSNTERNIQLLCENCNRSKGRTV